MNPQIKSTPHKPRSNQKKTPVHHEVWLHLREAERLIQSFQSEFPLISRWIEKHSKITEKFRSGPRKYPETFQTKVNGIACGVHVHYYDPGTHRPIHSASLEPNDPEEFEFSLLRKSGTINRWLESKLTEEDYERIRIEYLAQQANEI